jgi:hypothetical protein
MLDSRFIDTIYLIEANSYERQALWAEFHTQLRWEHDCIGAVIQVGELDNRPVNIDVLWTKIDGYRIAFWDACSQVVDHKMIEDWLRQNLPKVPKTNSMNFHNMIHKIHPEGWPFGPVTDEDLRELLLRSEKTGQTRVWSLLTEISGIVPRSRS